ncbi:MAG: cyclic-di-AMP receptor [Oscillospiraceae bacterium]|nr:cyclic-di-AMP receptor [Oscillospiraceae bacterium]
MKIIIAIVSNEDNSKVSSCLNKSGFFVTKLSSTGSFLMSGNTTLLIGTDDDKVDSVIDIIKTYSKKRTRMVASSSSFGMDMSMSIPVEVSVGGATIFVLNVDKFEKI